MEKVMTNGFCELNEQEMMMVDGGWDGWMWLKGAGTTVVGCVGAITSVVIMNPGLTESSLTVMAGGIKMCEDSFDF